MNTVRAIPPREAPSSCAAIDAALRSVAPSWPLDRQIAVNPWWGFIDHPFDHAAGTLQRLVGIRFTLAPGEHLRAWNAGEVTAAALVRAMAERGLQTTIDDAVAALAAPGAAHEGLPLPCDVLDQHRSPGAGPRWRDTVTQQVSQYCASYFDEHQADWHRSRIGGLFCGWRRSLEIDHALEPLMDAPEIRARAREIPGNADAAIAWALDRLGISPEEALDFLQVCLLRIIGWASWCAYLEWDARLSGSADRHLRQLLAIRVSWEALLHDGREDAHSALAHWRAQWSAARHREPPSSLAWDLTWARALEISYQDCLIDLLVAQGARIDWPRARGPLAAQLIFCIDVRSERIRRALEACDPAIETRGFAGFFGLPIRYTPIGTTASRPQLPGPLAPAVEATDTTGDPAQDAAIAGRRTSSLAQRGRWLPFLRSPTGAFSFVESLGVGYAGAILRRHFGATSIAPESFGLASRDRRALHPHVCLPDGDGADRKAELVASILRAMSLIGGFARLLVLVGHGSRSANNPQAAALDCGACGGHTGEINARALAALINEPEVRAALATRGIDIPPGTIAVGALHDTTTDEVRLFDLERLPSSHAADLERLRRSLADAGHATRAERAPSLGLAALADRPQALLKQLRRRGRDWAQTRPEWGLAGNAAFIVAPRSRTRGLDLAGRCFLHDYSWEDDQDGRVLELIMTAPMVVTHWINLQYYASTVDPDRFGSGNKVLHNVACGRIGVFEGNTGDLRIGLSRQSLHDGERWVHTPLRLSVFIDAPRERIEGILVRHPAVRDLVDNRWLHLFRFADGGVEGRHEGEWRLQPSGCAQRITAGAGDSNGVART